MPFRLSPEGELIFFSPRRPGVGEERTTEELIEEYLAERDAEAAEEAAAQAQERGLAENISATGTESTRGETTRDITGQETIRTDETITQQTRVYIDVPTPEEFLDDFSNAFAGFAQGMAQAGMSGADLNNMLDPSLGFFNTMMNEYIGNLAQRAARDEDLYDIAGLDGEPERIGEREGRRTEQEFTRTTRTQAEEILRQRGETITEENITRVIDEETQRQQESITAQQDETVTTTEDTTRTETGTSAFEETEELFRRPKVTPIFKFSPTDFLSGRFGAEEMDEAAIGRLTTEIRASAPRRRPQGGTPSISARRA